MRVGFVVPHLSTPSGWRTATLGAIKSLSETSDLMAYVFVSNDDFIAASQLFPEFKIIKLPEIQFFQLSSYTAWKRVLKTWFTIRFGDMPKLDIVHALDAYPTGLIAYWIAKRIKAPYILTCLGTYAVKWHRHPIDNRMYKRVLLNASYICPMSNGTENMMLKYYRNILSKKRVSIVTMGTDYCSKIPEHIAFQRQPAYPPFILSVGEVKPRKGHYISLKAFGIVKEKVPQAKYLIVGRCENGEYMDLLKTLIEETSLKDVEFLGVISSDQLQALYSSASVFLLTPQNIDDNFEGFGLVYLEAGAYGVPVVGTNTGGVSDMVQNGVTGYISEPDDIDGIANTIIKLLTDNDAAREMGLRNRKLSENLTWDRFAEQQYKLYQELLSNTIIQN